ncbi:MAG TPA: hypothetical protein DCM86_00165 [Verrucomicrobiales bacterium]|nr:hypothetical protein [Verrucomicrobiales bacterium]
MNTDPGAERSYDRAPHIAIHKPRIVFIIPRGEAVRNFLFSDTLEAVGEHARVTVLSVVDDERYVGRCRPFVEEILSLREYAPNPMVARVRSIVENAHDLWLWSEVAKNNWELRDLRAAEQGRLWPRKLLKLFSKSLANQPSLQLLTRLERELQYRLRPTQEFNRLFERLKPDLVFNGSHIHGLAGELPTRVAHHMGIPTAGFVFSWDNLTSRSRIMAPYDYWFVWNQHMRGQLLGFYPEVRPGSVFVTGTPQFDFHFNPKYRLSREEVCRKIGIDPARPFILYTSGIYNHFFEEHKHLQSIIRHLQSIDVHPRPQLVVRNYAKGTSDELKEMARGSYPDVVFPPVTWDEKWWMPLHEDLYLYSSLVEHAHMSINAASTVTLEFMMKDKPVINLDFDPPGSHLKYCQGYQRHIRFDHFWPVAQSGGTMVTRSEGEMREALIRGLTQPKADSAARMRFVQDFFGDTLDGRSGFRVAERLVDLARRDSHDRTARP